MNTKNRPNKQHQTNQRQKSRQEQGPPKRRKNTNLSHHEQEHPETRMTR